MSRKDKRPKDYLALHKTCMGFAVIFPSVVAFGKILVALMQLHYGSGCILGQTEISICYTIGYIIQCIFLLVTMSLYDRRIGIFHIKAVQWNLFAYMTFLLLFCIASVSSFYFTTQEQQQNLCFSNTVQFRSSQR